MTASTTSNDIPLASNPINRAAHYRTDPAWLEAALQSDNVLVFLMQDGRPLVEPSGKNMVWLGPEYAKLKHVKENVFIGLDRANAPIFGVNVDGGFKLEGSLLQGAGEFVDMRAAASTLSPMEANLAATARSILEWHRSHPFCSKCG
ncbi:MAG: NUDIX-like domain-containing protein, partial [Pseudomonadota bacterium]